MKKCSIVALHGFLGRPADWEMLGLERLKAINLFNFTTWTHLWEWAKQFNESFSKEFSSHSILMGYSLGGRLALHALIQDPFHWKAGVIISAHPGLRQQEEKEKRLKRDQEWGRRFKQENWNRLMADWNNQPIFSVNGFQFLREEKDFQRDCLVYFLEQASLGRQDCLQEQISQLNIPLLWLVGQKDHAYCHLTKELTFAHPLSQRCVIEAAGHRIPWEQPEIFKQKIGYFLEQIDSVNIIYRR